MSLFAGLFPSTTGSVSTLFSEQNRFKRTHDDIIRATEQSEAALDPSKKKKRKGTKEAATRNSELSEQPVAKKARKEKATEPNTTIETLPSQPATEVQQATRATDKASSKIGKPQKMQLQANKKPSQQATGSTPPAKGQNKPTESRPEKASGPAVAANGATEAEADARKKAQEVEAVSDGAERHDGDKDESASDEEEPQHAEGKDGATAGDEPAPVKRRRTEEEKAERLRRTIFVGNLPVKVKAKLIKQTFSQYGTVESVRLRSLPLKEDAKLPRRAAVAAGAVNDARGSANAYVVFSSGAAAVHALAHNMREFEGRHIRVDRAAAVSKGTTGGGTQVIYDSARSVFVGNLPFDTQDEELIELFGDGKGGPGNVTAVRVVRDAKTSVGKGIAFVEFSGRPAARMAMSADGRVLRGRQIRVARVAKSGAAAAAAGEAAAASGSRLRTPFSRGVKVGKMNGAAPRKGARAGKGEGTPRAGGQAAWQGMRTKGQKKVIGGFAAKERDVPSAGPGRPQTGEDGKGVGGKLKGKRPSVAARKEKLRSTTKQKRT